MLGVTAVLALGLPAGANALVYCVGAATADCKYGPYSGTGDGLQAALTDADVNIRCWTPLDTVRIGPGIYQRTGGDGFTTTSNDITIEGAGQSTVLTTDATSSRIVLRTTGGGNGASVRNLRADVAGVANGIEDFGTVSDVRISGPGHAIVGIQLPSGGRLTRATIDPATIYGNAVRMFGGVAEDVVVRLRNGGGPFCRAISVGSGPAPTTTETIRHLTVLGDNSATTNGVLALVSSGSPAPTLNVDLRDSVLRGVERPLYHFASAPNPGTANIAYRYSSLDLTPGKSLNESRSLVAGPGNLNDPDPLFAADLSLLTGSPLIDAGDPAGPETGDSATDVAGNPRIFGATATSARSINRRERRRRPRGRCDRKRPGRLAEGARRGRQRS